MAFRPDDMSARRTAFRLGLSAESRAAFLLIAKGFRIVARRFRTPVGEIDIVARRRGLLTIAWAGKDGGRFPEVADYCFVVPSYSIHRIQEVHATLVHIAWDLIHLVLGAEDVI